VAAKEASSMGPVDTRSRDAERGRGPGRRRRRTPRPFLIAGAAALLACQGDRSTPPAAGLGQALTGADGLRVTVIDGEGQRSTAASPAPAPTGVIVRLRGRAAFEAHAAERGRGGSLAVAAAASRAQRATLRAQHGRIVRALAGKLGGLAARGPGRATVLGPSYDDFTDVLNALALHGLDVASARRLLADESEVESIAPL